MDSVRREMGVRRVRTPAATSLIPRAKKTGLEA
jgi:hypothetical protein